MDGALGVTIGPEMVLLSTDYGWNHELPRPGAGLHSHVDALWDAGAIEAQLRRMVRENPARLLRLIDSRRRRGTDRTGPTAGGWVGAVGLEPMDPLREALPSTSIM